MRQATEIPASLDNGERMIPDAHKGAVVYTEHVVRYIFAAPLVAGKSVLDIACGSGYGTEVLKQGGAREVVGVDLEPEAVRYAAGRYSERRPHFLAGNAERLPFRDASFEAIVSFETIEHLHDPFAFLAEVRRVLVPDGLFVVSSPNKGVFAEGNPFHVHEFTYDELQVALTENFKNVRTYLQNDWIASAIMTQPTTEFEGRLDSEVQLQKIAALHPQETLYMLSVCSDAEVPEPADLMAVGQVYEMKGFMEETARLNHQIEELQKLWPVIEEKDGHITNLWAMVHEKDAIIQEMQKAAARSKSPLGQVRRLVARPVRFVRALVSGNRERAN